MNSIQLSRVRLFATPWIAERQLCNCIDVSVSMYFDGKINILIDYSYIWNKYWDIKTD